MYIFILALSAPNGALEYIARSERGDIRGLQRDLANDGEQILGVTQVPLTAFGEHAPMLWALIQVGNSSHGTSSVCVYNLIARSVPRHRRGVQMTVTGAGRVLKGPAKALWNAWRQFEPTNIAQDRLLWKLTEVLAEHMRR